MVELKHKDLDEERIKKILFCTKCFGDSTMSHSDMKRMTWVEYLLDRESVISSFQDRPPYIQFRW